MNYYALYELMKLLFEWLNKSVISIFKSVIFWCFCQFLCEFPMLLADFFNTQIQNAKMIQIRPDPDPHHCLKQINTVGQKS